MNLLTHPIRIPLYGIIFAVVIIVIGAFNTWNLLVLQLKVYWVVDHHLPASLALDDWTYAPTLAVEAKTKPSNQE